MDDRSWEERWSEGWLCVLFFLLPLVLHNGYFDITETKTAVYAGLTAIYLSGMLFLSACGHALRRPTAGAWAFLLFAGVNCLSSLLFGGRAALLAPHNRYQGALMWPLYAGMVLSLSAFGRFSRAPRRAALGAFAAVSLLCVLNALHVDPLRVTEGMRAADLSRYLSTIGNVNFIGAYVSLLLPMSMAYFCLADTRAELLLRGAVCVLGAGALLSGSDCGLLGTGAAALMLPWLLRRDDRALRRLPALIALMSLSLRLFAWLLGKGIGLSRPAAALCSLPVTALLLLLSGALFLFERKADEPRLAAAAGNYPVLPAALLLALALFLLLANTLLRDRLPAGIARFAVFSSDWGTDRGAVWAHCLTLYRSFSPGKKLIGGGAGCLALYDAAHRLFPDSVLDSAHNEYLHYLLTGGAVGLGAYLTSLGLALRRCRDGEAEVIPLLAAVFGCAVQGAVNIAQCTTTPLLFALLALLLRDVGEPRNT